MPFNTRNPIPSGDLRDLDDNARNIDTWANDKTKLSHPDRFGVERYTWHGIEQKAQLDIDDAARDAADQAASEATVQANDARDAAFLARDQAIAAKLAAENAAAASGVTKYADTKAILSAGVGTLYVNGDVVLVFADESQSGASAIYKIEANTAVFKALFDQTRADLRSFTGDISAAADWSEIPAHTDPALDVQAQALTDRIEMIGSSASFGADDLSVVLSALEKMPVGATMSARDTGNTFVKTPSGDIKLTSGGKGSEVDLVELGGVGDGLPHTVAELIFPAARGRYKSLSELQMDYPHVTSLSDCINWAAAQKAVNSFTGGGCLVLTTGDYVFTKEVMNRNSNVKIDGRGYVRVFSISDPNTSFHCFRSERAQAFTVDTTVVGRIGKRATKIEVTDATGLLPGDAIRITSSEYFNGFDGTSGYAVITKGEYNTVKKVIGNDVYLLETAKDIYNSGYTIRLVKCDFGSNFEVSGIHFYGEGETPEAAANDGLGSKGFGTDYWDGVRVTNCTFQNHRRSGMDIRRSRNVLVTSNQFLGYDITKSNNQPDGSIWFTGAAFFQSENVVFANNITRNARRPCDFDGAVGQAVSRNVLIANNISINCQSVQGTHHVHGVTIVGNRGIGCEGGIIMRGKDATIAFNELGYLAGYLIQLGSGPTDQAYTTPSTNGKVVIVGNTGSTTGEGVTSRVQCETLKVANNDFECAGASGLHFLGRIVKDVTVLGNRFAWIGEDEPTNSNHGIYIRNRFNGALKVARNIKITGNTFNGFYDGIRYSGATIGESPSDAILISDNTFESILSKDIRFVRESSSNGHGLIARAKIKDNFFSMVDPIEYGNNGYGIATSGNMTPGGGFDGNDLPANDSPTLSAGRARVGQTIRNTNPQPGGYEKWICVRAGNTGQVASTRVSINLGEDFATMLTVPSNILVGDPIQINASGGTGTTMTTTVTGISGNILRLADVSTLSGESQSVSWIAPIFKGVGLIEA